MASSEVAFPGLPDYISLPFLASDKSLRCPHPGFFMMVYFLIWWRHLLVKYRIYYRLKLHRLDMKFRCSAHWYWSFPCFGRCGHLYSLIGGNHSTLPSYYACFTLGLCWVFGQSVFPCTIVAFCRAKLAVSSVIQIGSQYCPVVGLMFETRLPCVPGA